MDRGLISFFEVTSCGFYRYQNKKNIHIEGSMEESLSMVDNWLRGRDFTETLPWDEESSTRTRVYGKTLATDEKTKDTVFVLWKRFDDGSGKISGISPDAKFGSSITDSVQIGTTVKGGAAILGDPMYYWFIPEHNVIASINFSHSSAATDDVCDYIKRCIDLRIDHPRKKTSESMVFNPFKDKEVKRKNVTYTSEDGSYALKYKFTVKSKMISSKNADIEKLSKNITHLIFRDTISSELKDERGSHFKLYDLFRGIKRDDRLRKEIELVEEVNLSEEELTSIFKMHEEQYDPDSPWNDIGFKEKDSKSPRFFSKYMNKERILLPGLKAKQTYYSAEEILEALQHERESLLYSVEQHIASIAVEKRKSA
ncbi:hypothetical protein HWV00_01830 [Moritella sp. 24]|uniref:hypothetical protein n=1 Tax=Moritella sp. 24 TaxID=2746230 RepID=UPI001BAB2862|nr:hypothetical protein [Moritella sp. 24]QUM75080.1 hypothetical protein HWV00_01830 [Moritella sp. 24]